MPVSFLCYSLISCHKPPSGARLPGQALQSFELVECFGVSHPDQIVFFDLKRQEDPSRVALVDDSGQAAPFQIVSNGHLAVRTRLAPNEKRKWTLCRSRVQSQSGSDLGLTETGAFFEITNSFIGIRIPKVPANLKPTPSPIQGLKYRDGTWTATGPNYMEQPALGMKVEWLERGPLLIRAKITYRYTRSELRGAFEKEVIPAGEGDYACTIEVQSGQPSVLFQEYSEVEIAWGVNVDHGLAPDRAQYRGHHSTSIEAGRNSDGTWYGCIQTGAGPNLSGARGKDALINLDYTSGRKERFSDTRYSLMSHWDPWAFDTGWYWQMYSTNAANDNLLGIFAGPPSRLGKTGVSGVSFDARMIEGAKRLTGLHVKFARLMPTQFYARTIRFDWGLFLGRKSDDLKPLDQVQGVGRQMNLHSGVNLTKLQHITGEFPDPPQGYGNLYVSSNVWMRMATKLQTEKKEGRTEYFNQLTIVDASAKPLFEFWRDGSPEAAKSRLEAIDSDARDHVDTLVNGQGIYRHDRCYFMAALNWSGRFVDADQLLASGLLTAEQKSRLKCALELYTACLWDHDLAPMQEGTNINWGPANMASMWLGMRYIYTLMLASHPRYAERAHGISEVAVKQLHDYVNEYGAANASTHYTGASMIPILNLMQQLQMSGIKDHFRDEPLLQKFAEFYMQQLTPPEVRFGGVRKIVAIGDGSTEASAIHGQLGTGFASSHPELSKRLMGAWDSMGQSHNAFFGPSLLKTDSSRPAVSPDLGNAQFRGWCSVLRYGWGTTNESAIWFVNGDTLTDHRHNDQGQVLIYALGAPLALDWGPIYYPRVSGGLMHSTVMPESALKHAWDSDNTDFNDPPASSHSTWWFTTNDTFQSFQNSSSSAASFRAAPESQMRRTVRLVHPDPTRPIILVEDQFMGTNGQTAPMIFTLNQTATGEVVTPGGKLLPETRFYNNRDPKNQQLPSSTKPADLAVGVNRFQFTGQWRIDWDLYVAVASPQQFTLGNWGHNWHPSTELNEFRKAQGREFDERQHILRLRGKNGFRVLILPRQKSDSRPPLQAQREGDAWSITGPDFDVHLTDRGYVFQSAERKVLTAFGAEPTEAFGIKLAGGPAEVMMTSTNCALTISGGAGTRHVDLPKGWSVRGPLESKTVTVRQSGDAYQVEVNQDESATLELVRP